MNLMVCGGRDFNDKELLFKTLDDLVAKKGWKDIIILEGEAKGADTLAKDYVAKRNLLFKPYPADWKNWGKAAGPIRNKAMVTDCDYCVAFWDGQSRGTRSSIEFCRELNKPYTIVLYRDCLDKNVDQTN